MSNCKDCSILKRIENKERMYEILYDYIEDWSIKKAITQAIQKYLKEG